MEKDTLNENDLEDMIFNTTTTICRDIMEGVNEEPLQGLKNCLLTMCELIDTYYKDFNAKKLIMILDRIVYHITVNPHRINLILDHLFYFDKMITNFNSCLSLDKTIEKFYEDITKNILNISKQVHSEPNNTTNDSQLNLFNSDGTRCSMDELLNS